MEEVIEVFGILTTVTLVPMLGYFGWKYLDLWYKREKRKFDYEMHDEHPDLLAIQKRLKIVEHENDELREDIQHLKYILQQQNKTPLSAFEKEQIELDNRTNKFKY